MYYIILRGYGERNKSIIPTFYVTNDCSNYRIGDVIKHRANCKLYIVVDIVKSNQKEVFT